MCTASGTTGMDVKTIKIMTPSNYEVRVRTVQGWLTKCKVTKYSPTMILTVEVSKGEYSKQKQLPRVGYVEKDMEGMAYCKSNIESMLASAVHEARTAPEDTTRRDAFNSIVTILAEVEEAVQTVKDKMPYYNYNK